MPEIVLTGAGKHPFAGGAAPASYRITESQTHTGAGLRLHFLRQTVCRYPVNSWWLTATTP